MKVGFDRFIRLQWLDQALELALSKPGQDEARKALESLIGQEVTGEEARRKVVRRLDAIWIHPPKHVRVLRNAALELFITDSSRNTSLPLHWGMVMAVYPFFGTVAENIGRILEHHDSVLSTQVIRRIQQTHGERPTVERATQRILQSLSDWQVLERSDTENIFHPSEKRLVTDIRLTAWLLEAALHARSVASSFLTPLLHWPAFFPFEVQLLDERVLEKSGRLSLHRQGVNRDVVMLEE